MIFLAIMWKWIVKLVLMLIAIAINIAEALIMAISYSLWFIGFIIHDVFKQISILMFSLAKRFNFISVFRNFEE